MMIIMVIVGKTDVLYALHNLRTSPLVCFLNKINFVNGKT